jgi:hypothetical protein
MGEILSFFKLKSGGECSQIFYEYLNLFLIPNETAHCAQLKVEPITTRGQLLKGK